MKLEAYFDGACRGGNPGHCSFAYAIYLDGVEMLSASAVLPGLNTNSVSEYTALVMLLRMLATLDLKNVTIFGDSQFVVNQILGKYAVRAEHLKKFYSEASALYIRGDHRIVHVRGHMGIEGNERVDSLCNIALDEEEKNGTNDGSSSD